MTFLILEDNEGDARLLEIYIEEAFPQSEVDIARSIEEARPLLASQLYEALFVDLNLPDSSGFDTIKVVRPLCASTPLIVLTGSSAERFAVTSLGLGAQDFLEKDGLSPATLANAVQYATARAARESRDEEGKLEVEAARRFQSLGQMSTEFLHELSTPLQSLRTNLEYLTNARFDETSRESVSEALEDSRKSVEHCINVLTSFRALAHPSLDQPSRVSPVDVLRTALELTKTQRGSKIELTTDIDREVPPILGYERDLCSALTHILGNAALATRGSEREPRIHASLAAEADGTTVIKIEDTGLGVPDQHRTRVFDPFFTTRSRGEGTGMGLALANLTVSVRHSGQLEVHQSQILGGASFEIRIPAAS